MSDGIENLSVLHNACWENPKGNGGDSGSKISVDTFVKWGNIVGLLTDQTDLVAELNKRQTALDSKIKTIETNIEDLLPLIYAGL